MATSLLKISSAEVLNQFLHDCVDDLIRCKQVDFDSYNSDIEWTKEDYTSAINWIQNLYRESISACNKIDDSKLQDLSPHLQQCIKDCFEIRKKQIFQTIVVENLLKNGQQVVENYDWSLKWINGSSKLATLREPLLHVDLHCFKDENETERKNIKFEMNFEQVTKLTANLEQVLRDLRDGRVG